MDSKRSSGLLLHPTSLPGPFGIGDLGPEARQFAEFLVEAGQRWWQVLPLGPPGYGNSPYMCFSAFGGNPALISLDVLVQDGLLDPGEIAAPPVFSPDRVDFARVAEYKLPLLRRSHERFERRHATAPYPREYFEFCERNAFWLDDYALFQALKQAHGGQSWTQWTAGTASRDPGALIEWRSRLQDEIQFGKFLEYTFFAQWRALRRYCHDLGVRIIGDMPLYVAHDSAEVWASRKLFHLDAHGEPVVVAGVPPDYFSAMGQRWGNPIYRWETMAEDGYLWWQERLRAMHQLVDTVRIDHFRGFESYWEIPSRDPTAVRGQWVRGPGLAFFEAMRVALPEMSMIAEDLGVITPEVEALREQCGFPGMRILQMAFGGDPKAADYRPYRHTPDSIVYTATHDHNTTVGWFTMPPGAHSTQSPEEIARERQYFLDYTGSDGREPHWEMIRLAMSSPARLCMIPVQDVLGLGAQARMNLPGTLQGNWEWRLEPGGLGALAARRLRDLSRTFERDRQAGVPPQ